MDKVYTTFWAVVSDITDGVTIVIGSFGSLAGTLQHLLLGLHSRGKEAERCFIGEMLLIPRKLQSLESNKRLVD